MYKLCKEILDELEQDGVKVNHNYEYPKKQELKLRLKDVLEPQVDEKYYLSDEQTKRLRMTTFHSGKEENRVQDSEGECRTLLARDYKDPKCVQVAQMYGFSKEPNPQAGRIYDANGISPTMDTMSGGNRMPKIVAQRGRAYRNEPQHLEARKDDLTNTITSVAKDNYVAESVGGVAIRTANKQGYDMATDGDSVDLSYPQSKTKRGRVGHEISKTLMAADCMGTIDNYRIRKLTPKECWRLMSFDDKDFDKAKASGVSDSQLYKQAGNSIVVKVLEGILRNLLIDQ